MSVLDYFNFSCNFNELSELEVSIDSYCNKKYKNILNQQKINLFKEKTDEPTDIKIVVKTVNKNYLMCQKLFMFSLPDNNSIENILFHDGVYFAKNKSLYKNKKLYKVSI